MDWGAVPLSIARSPDPRVRIEPALALHAMRGSCAVAASVRGAVVVERPATVDVIEIPRVSWVNRLPAPRAFHVSALDLPSPLLTQTAMSGAVLCVMRWIDRLRLAMPKTEPVPGRFRNEVGLTARLGALPTFTHQRSPHRGGISQGGGQAPVLCLKTQP